MVDFMIARCPGPVTVKQAKIIDISTLSCLSIHCFRSFSNLSCAAMTVLEIRGFLLQAFQTSHIYSVFF